MADPRTYPLAATVYSYGDISDAPNFTSFAAFEALTDVDMPAQLLGYGLIMLNHTSPYDDVISFAGGINDDNYFRYIEPEAGYEPNGRVDSLPAIHYTGAAHSFAVSEDGVRLYNIAHANHGAAARYSFYLTKKAVLVGCVSQEPGELTPASTAFQASTAECFLYSCMAYKPGLRGFYYFSASVSSRYYGCMSIDSGQQGFFAGAVDVMDLKNCYVGGTVGNPFSGTYHADSDYNRTDHTQLPPGANSLGSSPAVFVDAAGGDFHLDASDTNLRGQGLDLSGDAVAPYNYDCDNEEIAEWSIGWDSKNVLAAISAGRYEVLTVLTGQALSPWESMLGVSGSIVSPYEALLGLLSDSVGIWSSEGVILASMVTPYITIGGLLRSSASLYEVLVTVQQENPALFSALANYTVSQQTQWGSVLSLTVPNFVLLEDFTMHSSS